MRGPPSWDVAWSRSVADLPGTYGHLDAKRGDLAGGSMSGGDRGGHRAELSLVMSGFTGEEDDVGDRFGELPRCVAATDLHVAINTARIRVLDPVVGVGGKNLGSHVFFG